MGYRNKYFLQQKGRLKCFILYKEDGYSKLMLCTMQLHLLRGRRQYSVVIEKEAVITLKLVN